jgi:hypothetical protein
VRALPASEGAGKKVLGIVGSIFGASIAFFGVKALGGIFMWPQP